MLITEHGHTFVGPLSGVVIDVGCYGFDFSLAAIDHGASKVLCFDLEDLTPPPVDKLRFFPCAVTAGSHQRRFIQETKRNAWRLSPVGQHIVASTTLSAIMQSQNIDNVELLKLDCEGSELEILENLPDGIQQISVEFHLHVWPKQQRRVDHLIRSLSHRFHVVQHSITKRHSADKWNYWDTLLVKK